MMSLEQPATETAWFSAIFTLTSWITSSLLLVRMRSSDRCGLNLSGKTKLVFKTYKTYVIVCCLGLLLMFIVNSVSCSTSAHYINIISWDTNIFQHTHWILASSNLFSYCYFTCFTSLMVK